MELEGVPSRFAKQASRMGEKKPFAAISTAPAGFTVKEVKVRTGFWLGKISDPIFMKDAHGRDIKFETYPLFAALVWVIVMHVTSAAAERNWSIWGQIYADARRSSLEIIKAEMLVRIMSWYRGMKTKEDRAVSTVLCLDFVEVEEEEEV